MTDQKTVFMCDACSYRKFSIFFFEFPKIFGFKLGKDKIWATCLQCLKTHKLPVNHTFEILTSLTRGK